MNATQAIHQSSGKVDFGTPPGILDAARRTMGGIDLDPATAPYWNKIVRAGRYWHVSNTSNRWYAPQRVHPLDRSWRVFGEPSRVWLNHPYGRKRNYAWVEKVIHEYRVGNVAQACVLTWAEQSTQWGAMLRQFPRWIPDWRLAHISRNGKRLKGSVKGSMVTYIGKNIEEFYYAFTVANGGSVDLPARDVIGEW